MTSQSTFLAHGLK